MTGRPPLAPFTPEMAVHKVRLAAVAMFVDERGFASASARRGNRPEARRARVTL
jgi:nuclear transport factor 2 (NTF2) superfamily protein